MSRRVITASARAGVAVIWKIVLVVEVLGRSSGGGFQIPLSFQLFGVAMVLVHAFRLIAGMLAVDWPAPQPLERRASRWRRT